MPRLLLLASIGLSGCKFSAAAAPLLVASGGSDGHGTSSKGLVFNIYSPDRRYVGRCAGSFITDQLLLTAAHCLQSSLADASGQYRRHGYVEVSAASGPFRDHPVVSEMLRPAPDYIASAPKGADWGTDLGFAVFAKNTAPAELIARLSTKPPQIGDPVVGAGSVADLLSEHLDAIAATALDLSRGSAERAGLTELGASLFNGEGDLIGVAHDLSTTNTLEASVFGNVQNKKYAEYIDQVKGEDHAALRNSETHDFSLISWRFATYNGSSHSRTVKSGECSLVNVTLNVAPQALAPNTPVQVQLRTSSPTARFYTDTDCTKPLTQPFAAVTAASGGLSLFVSYKETAFAAEATLSVSEIPAQGWAAGELNVTTR